MLTFRVLQFNMNHSGGAQDLALQVIDEDQNDLGCFSEPWRIPVNSAWFGSVSGRAAIYCNTSDIGRKCRLVTALDDWVAVSVGNIYIISCYLSPNESISSFNLTLEKISGFIKSKSDRVLLCGDFNARSVVWGCHSGNRRDSIMVEWSVWSRSWTCM